MANSNPAGLFRSVVIAVFVLTIDLSSEEKVRYKKDFKMGSGCGSVGVPVASDITGPRFESSHRQF